MMGALRSQLPVRSPVPIRDIASAALSTALPGQDARPALAAFLGDRFGAEDVILTASGTHALTLALRHAVRHLGDPSAPVLLPAWTCYDVASAAVGADVRVLFYDIDPRTLSPDLDSLRRGLRAGARIVVVNPLYGFPLPWADLDPLVRASGGLLVEDAAQGAHGRWDGRWSGSFGALSVLSFGRGKGWTGAGGGALLFRGSVRPDAEVQLAPGSAGLSTVGRAAAIRMLGVPALYGIPRGIPFLGLGETHYRPPTPPGAMGKAEAALVLGSSAQADAEANARKARAETYLTHLEPMQGIHLPRPGGDAESGYLRFPVLVPPADHPPMKRQIRLGIAGGYPIPLPFLEALKSRSVEAGSHIPGAMELASHLLTLPTHSGVRDGEIPQVVDALRGRGDR